MSFRWILVISTPGSKSAEVANSRWHGALVVARCPPALKMATVEQAGMSNEMEAEALQLRCCQASSQYWRLCFMGVKERSFQAFAGGTLDTHQQSSSAFVLVLWIY